MTPCMVVSSAVCTKVSAPTGIVTALPLTKAPPIKPTGPRIIIPPIAAPAAPAMLSAFCLANSPTVIGIKVPSTP